MTFIPMPPPMPRPWPPSGEPIGSYHSRRDARRVVKLLVKQGIPGLKVVSADQWWKVGRLLGSLGASGGLFVGLWIADLTSSGSLVIPLIVGVVVTGLLLGAIGAGIGYLEEDRRTRRFLLGFSPPIVARHVVLCEPSHAQRARDLLTTASPTT